MSSTAQHDDGCAVVTGGASGIGSETVQRLLAQGRRVAVLDRSSRPAGLPESVLFLNTDVSDPDAVAVAFDEIDVSLGRVSQLVCSAGMGVPRTATVDLSPRLFHKVHAVHVGGTLFACQQAARRMTPGSSIVTIGSVTSAVGSPRRVAYAAAKGAIVALTRSLAVEWAPLGIRVNCVAPGYISTPLVADALTSGAMPEDPSSHAAMGRLGTAAEVAGPILFLLSDAAAYVTGETFHVDGGFLVLKTQ
jgi:NAD(P)-dependent dehydrogenase (short-subunit alcohol dehydrogenase family)